MMELYQLYYVVPFIVALLAQWLKLVIDAFSWKKITLRSLLVSGGMPSAHSTLTSSLLMMVILLEWGPSELTMIVAVYAILVWYDAANVRYESGKHAQYINSLKQEMHKVMTQEHIESINNYVFPTFWLLKERLWHTPVEIFIGILFGGVATLVVVSLIDMYIISFSNVIW